MNIIPQFRKVWSDEWMEETLKTFNVPFEAEWDLCDFCNTQTHVHIGKWIIIEGNTKLACNRCQHSIQ